MIQRVYIRFSNPPPGILCGKAEFLGVLGNVSYCLKSGKEFSGLSLQLATCANLVIVVRVLLTKNLIEFVLAEL